MVLLLIMVTVQLVVVANAPQVTYAFSPMPFSATQTGVLQRPSGSVGYKRLQFGARASGSYLVWGERNFPTQQASAAIADFDSLSDTLDIAAYNLATSTSTSAATLSGNQAEPAISGSILVWEDNAHSCPSCENDILGKNLSTGATFTVASGSVDQSHPAIDGTKAVWIESSSTTQKVMLKDINPVTSPAVIASVVVTNGLTLLRPVLSSEYVVWAEMADPVSAGGAFTTTLKAYKRSNGVVSTLATLKDTGIEFALADHRVVWNDTRVLHLTDMSTSVSSILNAQWGGGASPAINGNIVTWSAGSGNESNGFDIWGLNLSGGMNAPLLLVSQPGDQLGAVMAGDVLAWQNEGGTDADRITTTSLSALFASPPTQPTLSQEATPTATPISEQPLPITHPLIKGVHAPNGDGWCDNHGNCSNSTSAVDALVDRAINFPYFGAVTVLQPDLDAWTTQAAAPWGPTVNDIMQGLTNNGTVPIVRTKPADRGVYQPQTTCCVSPNLDRDLVIDDLIDRPWMRRIQIENEPDREWSSSCSGCWYSGGTWHGNWSNKFDYRFYDAMDAWYGDVGGAFDVWANITCDPNQLGCERLRDHTITVWSPPLDPGLGYQNLTNGENRYNRLPRFYRAFYNWYPYDQTGNQFPAHFSYHAYPVPNGTGNFGGGIRNNSWDWFNADLKNLINMGNVAQGMVTQITEFGWDPNQMITCDYTHDRTWTRIHSSIPDCNVTGSNPRDHTFPGDITDFQLNWRHNADTMTIWITRGWAGDDSQYRADGLNQSGTQRNWFVNYRSSAP
jgi:hypothetical protein